MFDHLNDVADVTARIRGNDPDRPIRVGHDRNSHRVVVVLDPDYAEQLASLLAQVDNLEDAARYRDPDTPPAYVVTRAEQQRWLHALVDVLAATADARHGSAFASTVVSGGGSR